MVGFKAGLPTVTAALITLTVAPGSIWSKPGRAMPDAVCRPRDEVIEECRSGPEAWESNSCRRSCTAVGVFTSVSALYRLPP